MYCISRSAGLTLPIRDRKVEYHPANGEVIKVHKALTVEFKRGGNVPPFAREAVQKLSGWGVGMGERDDPFTRCGAIDTEVEAELQGWDEDELRAVNEALIKANSNGREYIIVESPAALKPFPKYDEIVGERAAEQIGFYVEQLGLDPGAVRQYEIENANREDVVAAMNAAIEKQNEDVIEVISA